MQSVVRNTPTCQGKQKLVADNIIIFPKDKITKEEDAVSREEILEQREQIFKQQQEIIEQREIINRGR